MARRQNEAMLRSQVETLSKLLPGMEAIYHERLIVLRVRVRELRIDDWGVEIDADVIPTKGLIGPKKLRGCSGAWEVLGVGPTSIHAAEINWCVDSDPDLITDIVAFAETLPELDTSPGDGGVDKRIARYVQLRDRIREWQMRDHRTGRNDPSA